MSRKPRSPRSPHSLSSRDKKTVDSVISSIEGATTHQDSVPTADLSADDVFVIPDEPVVQIEDSSEQVAEKVRELFAAVCDDEEEEEKDSLLMRVSKRMRKKQGDSGDEVAAMRQQRQETRRHSMRVRVLWAGIAACLIAVCVYTVFFSPLFSLSLAKVAVSTPAGSTVDEGAIRTSLTTYQGRSIMRLSTGDVAKHIEDSVPGTDKVRVTRAWPHGLSITYSLKEPKACFYSEGSCKTVDEKGRFIPPTSTTDMGSIVHIYYSGTPEDMADAMTSIQGVLDEVDKVDKSIRPNVANVQIDAQNNMQLVLNDDRVVIWGQASDNQTKARVLSTLLSQEQRYSEYDISNPKAPVTY